MILKVEDVMVRDVIIVDADATVIEAVELINKHEIGCLIVTSRGKRRLLESSRKETC